MPPTSPDASAPATPRDAGAEPDAAISAPPDASIEPDLTPRDVLGLPPKLDFASGNWTLEPAFPQLTFDDPTSMKQAPRTTTFFVTERQGRIYAFEKDPATVTKTLVLDLSSVTQGENDCGLLDLAFHPDFGLEGSSRRAYLYLHYALSPSPIVGMRPRPDIPTRSRLARFTFDFATGRIDPLSEVILIDQQDEHLHHQGGSMFFHPDDGFLYLTVGDEGGVRCGFQNCQVIDKDLFAGVLRIDVDMRGGDVSHPIGRQPMSGTTADYYIPNDNPFVGQPEALEEFYAIGLRSPHRMTHDAIDDITWIGDVGDGMREEVDVLERGANYQWPVAQGFRINSAQTLPEPVIGVWTDPVIDFTRDESQCIIGGYVYRGSAMPELWGRYIFADFPTGLIYALPYSLESGKVVVKDLELLLSSRFNSAATGITSLATDADGELYVLTLGDSVQVQRLRGETPHANVVTDLRDLPGFEHGTPAPELGFHAYEVASALWSDGASKRRWFALPEGKKIEFSEQGAWTFPDGTVFVKHFEMALDERDPSRLTPLETRFLVSEAGGKYYGVTYQWSDDEARAELVLDRKTRDLSIIASDGSIRRQRYEFPGPNDCLVCHNPRAGYVLGMRTEQLNRVGGVLASHTENSIAALARLQLFEEAPDASAIASFPRLAPLSDETASLADRVRSYWGSNCSMCHGVDPEIRARWDARYSTPLDEQGVLLGAVHSPVAPEDQYLIIPGDHRASAMYRRVATIDRTAGAMPPLGRRRVDTEFLALMRRWIQSLPPESDANGP